MKRRTLLLCLSALSSLGVWAQAFIGPDRALKDVRGNAKSIVCERRNSGADQSTQGYTEEFHFTPDGYFADWFSIMDRMDVDPKNIKRAGESRLVEEIEPGHTHTATVKRDSEGRLTEMTFDCNNPEYLNPLCMASSVTYTWEDGRLKSYSMTVGLDRETHTFAYDNDGNIIEELFEVVDGFDPENSDEYPIIYTYKKFDSQGNWTERIEGDEEGSFIVRRTIVYY